MVLAEGQSYLVGEGTSQILVESCALAYVLASLSKVKGRSDCNQREDTYCLSCGKEKEDVVNHRDSLLVCIQER